MIVEIPEIPFAAWGSNQWTTAILSQTGAKLGYALDKARMNEYERRVMDCINTPLLHDVFNQIRRRT